MHAETQVIKSIGYVYDDGHKFPYFYDDDDYIVYLDGGGDYALACRHNNTFYDLTLNNNRLNFDTFQIAVMALNLFIKEKHNEIQRLEDLFR